MRIEIREAGKVRVVDLHGRLVLGPPTETLKNTVRKILAEGHNRILLDLRAVPYMDSAGIGELAACKKRVLERHGEIKIHRMPGQYHQAVESLIERMFQGSLFDDETRALLSFRHAAPLAGAEADHELPRHHHAGRANPPARD